MLEGQTVASSSGYLAYLGSAQGQAVFRLTQRVNAALRKFLDGRGFIELLPPIISTVTDPGLRGAERLSISLYGQKAFVTSSMVFHKQILATAMGRIYSFAPNVRLEPIANSATGRHLTEFCQLDVEERNASVDDSIALAEEMIAAVIAEVIADCAPLLSRLGRHLTVPALPFPRYSYDEMLSLARSMGIEVEYGDELPQAAEARVSAEVGSFFWIVDYPKACRGFYYRESEDPRTVRSMDLIYPEGFGEAISGGEREYRPREIRRRIAEAGLDEADFKAFLDLAEEGLQPTSGFGIGIERLIRFIAGLRDIAQTRPFPKRPGDLAM